MIDPTTDPTTESTGDAIAEVEPRPTGDGTTGTTTPQTTGVILIPPLGLEKVAKLTEGFSAWWSKHGSNARAAVVDLVALLVEVLKPTPPPTPPAQPTP